MKYTLGIKPDGTFRDYISYSAWSLWNQDKEKYRDRYYRNKEGFSSKEMAFGKEIAEMLENDDGQLKHIPRYEYPEYKLECTIDGIKLLAYLDSFDLKTCSILEYKTSHTRKDGSIPWSNLIVKKHKQLDWYSMMVEQIWGKVNNEVKLIWLETDWEDDVIYYNGHKLSKGNKLKLTGKVEIFKRKIYKYERTKIKKDIIKTVKEIHEDFTEYQKLHEQVGKTFL